MADADPVLCPECGWSGDRSEFVERDGEGVCPVCDGAVEFVD